MPGAPVLSTLVDGLARATPTAVRGIANATANVILKRMEEGVSYEGALGEAQELGLAERDPTADVEGYDTMAKAMILAALVSGRQLRVEEVACAAGSPDGDRTARSTGAHVELVTIESVEASPANGIVAQVGALCGSAR